LWVREEVTSSPALVLQYKTTRIDEELKLFSPLSFARALFLSIIFIAV
jgi:hypothetical protein